jgi:hypothetical protein
MQPTAQAVGRKRNNDKPQRGEREATTVRPQFIPNQEFAAKFFVFYLMELTPYSSIL